jgi:hypothetical protein
MVAGLARREGLATAGEEGREDAGEPVRRA